MYGTKDFQRVSKNSDRHLDSIKYSVFIMDDKHAAFKAKAAEDNTTMHALMVKWVDEYLKENETKTE